MTNYGIKCTKNYNLPIHRPLRKDFQATEEAFSPVLQNMKFLNFFLLVMVIFALLDPDPDTDPLTWLNPDPKHCQNVNYLFVKKASDLIFFNLLQPSPSLPTVTLYVASFGLRLCLQGYQLGFQSWRRVSGWVSENLTLNSTNRKLIFPFSEWSFSRLDQWETFYPFSLLKTE